MPTLDSLDRNTLINVLKQMETISGTSLSYAYHIDKCNDSIRLLECRRTPVKTKRPGFTILFIIICALIFDSIAFASIAISLFSDVPDNVEDILPIIAMPFTIVFFIVAVILYKKIKAKLIERDAEKIAGKEFNTIDMKQIELQNMIEQLQKSIKENNKKFYSLCNKYCVPTDLWDFTAISSMREYITSNSRATLFEAINYAKMNKHHEEMEKYAKKSANDQAEYYKKKLEQDEKMYDEQVRHNRENERETARSNEIQNSQARRTADNVEIIKNQLKYGGR